MARKVNCYYCRKAFGDSDEVVEKVVLIKDKAGKGRRYNKKFHNTCVSKYEERGATLLVNESAPNKLDKEKVHYCYYCEGVIESENDIAWKKFPIATKIGRQWKNRKLHTECLLKYSAEIKDAELKKKENDEWDEVYQYFRSEILGIATKKPLDEHTIKRLQGLRIGQYYPSGNNTRILPRGYSFDIILLTLKVVKAKVRAYMSTVNFKDSKHKTNSIMTFVVGEINDVAMRLEKQRKSNEKLANEVIHSDNLDFMELFKESREKQQQQHEQDDDNDIEDLLGGLL